MADTNVLIDYYGRREPFFADSLRLRVMQSFGDAELWASAKSFTDVAFVLAKACDPLLLQNAIVQSLSFLKVCSVDGDDVRRAAEAGWPDFEDSLINQAALKVKADYIITRDKRGFSRADVPALTPRELLDLLEKDHGMVYEGLTLA